MMAKPVEARLAIMADPARRAELREAAMQPPASAAGRAGPLHLVASLVVSKTALATNKALEGRKLTQLAEELGKHVGRRDAGSGGSRRSWRPSSSCSRGRRRTTWP